MPGGVGEYQALNKKGRADVKAPESVMAVQSSWTSSWPHQRLGEHLKGAGRQNIIS